MVSARMLLTPSDKSDQVIGRHSPHRILENADVLLVGVDLRALLLNLAFQLTHLGLQLADALR